jgi:hypothetical protein
MQEKIDQIKARINGAKSDSQKLRFAFFELFRIAHTDKLSNNDLFEEFYKQEISKIISNVTNEIQANLIQKN